MPRRARPRSLLVSAFAVALSVAISGIAPGGWAPATSLGVGASPVDRDAPACPDDSRDTRDDGDGDQDDGDEESFVRSGASWASAPVLSKAPRVGLADRLARRGHRSVLERPPRA